MRQRWSPRRRPIGRGGAIANETNGSLDQSEVERSGICQIVADLRIAGTFDMVSAPGEPHEAKLGTKVGGGALEAMA